MTYRDGHVSRLTTTVNGRQASCPAVGRVTHPFHPQLVTAAQVAAKVTGQALLARYYCFPLRTRGQRLAVPCDSRIPPGLGRGSGKNYGLLIEIRFTARVGATNKHSVYEITLSDPSDPNCPTQGGGTDWTTMTPIRAGQHVVPQTYDNGCLGRYTELVTSPRADWAATLCTGRAQSTTDQRS